MSNHTVGQLETKLLGARVTPEFHKSVRIEAAKRDLDISGAVRQAMSHWLQTIHCPQCDQPTIPHPDPTMTGVRYCPACQESVSLDQSAQADQ